MNEKGVTKQMIQIGQLKDDNAYFLNNMTYNFKGQLL